MFYDSFNLLEKHNDTLQKGFSSKKSSNFRKKQNNVIVIILFGSKVIVKVMHGVALSKALYANTGPL